MLDKSWLEERTTQVRLPDGSCIYQHKQGQKISSDNEDFNSILTRRFQGSSYQGLKVLELGVGNGINSIMLKKEFPTWDITALELDHEQAKLASYNCDLLGLTIKIEESDFRAYLTSVKYDLIIANPPYQKVGSGRLSPYERTNLAKFELTCTMEDVFLALKRNLALNGEAWLLYAQDREDDIREFINQGQFKEIEMIRKNKILIVGLKYVAN